MNKSLKFLWLTFLVAMLVVGCASGEETNQAEGNTENSGTEGDSGNGDGDTSSNTDVLFAEPKTFSMLNKSAAGSWPYSEDQPIWGWITEKTNVTLDMNAVPAPNYEDQYNLTMSSGELPDIILQNGFDRAKEYGLQGAFVNLNEYKDMMPNMFKALEENPEMKDMTIAANGELYTAPAVNSGIQNLRHWMYREDVFEKHDLDVPTTWEALYEVSKELQDIYPESHPFIFRNDFGHLPLLAPSFGIDGSFYADPETGEYKFGPIQDEYKEMVKWLIKFHEEGIMPQTWLTDKTEDWQRYISQNQSFITIDYVGRIDFLNVPLREEDPDATFKFMPPPQGIEGVEPQIEYTAMDSIGMSIASTSDQIEDVVKYIDWHYTEEGRRISGLGGEGVSYEVVNGEPEILDKFSEFSDIRKEIGVITNGAYLAVFEEDNALRLMASEEMQDAFAQAPEYTADPHILPPLTAEESDEASLINEAVVKTYEENIANFIIGKKSMDEWDQYVEKVNQAGLPRLLEIYQTAHDRIKE